MALNKDFKREYDAYNIKTRNKDLPENKIYSCWGDYLIFHCVLIMCFDLKVN